MSVKTLMDFEIRLTKCIVLLGLLSLIFSGCGGGGGGDSSVNNDGGTLPPANAEQGVFIDSEVSGIDYKTLTYSGVTDADGTFQYLTGETVTFSIGDLELGSSIAKDYVTPMDLVPGAENVTNPMVTNLCKLLQVLDYDGDPSNGIEITEEMKAIVSDADLDFELSTLEFGTAQKTMDLLQTLNSEDVFLDSTERELPSDEEAQSHLEDSLSNFAVSFDFTFLQYRTSEDGDYSIRGWVGFSKNGNPISSSDIASIVLNNEGGDTIPIEKTIFWSNAYYFGNWNNSTSNVDYSGPFHDSGLSVYFTQTTLPAGNYTYKATTDSGDILTQTLYYPGEETLPCVDSDSMTFEWQPDGSLHLSWESPTDSEFDMLRVVLDDQDKDGSDGNLLYVDLPIDATEVTIPSDQVLKIDDLDQPYIVKWVIQTRSNTSTSDNNRYARGYSDKKFIPWSGATADFAVSLDYSYLQFRTHDDGSHSIRGWLSFTKNGNPIAESNITKIELINLNGDIIPISDVSFWRDASYSGSWNNDTSNVEYGEPYSDSGFSLSFSSITTLPSGNYTYEATTDDGHILTDTVYYPAEETLPCVDNASMEYEWLNDGSLQLSWESPTDSNYDELRVVFSDQDKNGEWGDLLYVKLPIDATEVTISSDQIQNIEDLDDPYIVRWVVQTRSYTSDRNMYARGYSEEVPFFWPGAAGGSPYYVYGGDAPPESQEGFSPADHGYNLLGTATATQQFDGAYDYYIIVTNPLNVAFVDAVEGSDGLYVTNVGGGNSLDIPNIRFAPDENYAQIGGGYVIDWGGYAVINAPGAGLTSITVYIKP